MKKGPGSEMLPPTVLMDCCPNRGVDGNPDLEFYSKGTNQPRTAAGRIFRGRFLAQPASEIAILHGQLFTGGIPRACLDPPTRTPGRHQITQSACGNMAPCITVPLREPPTCRGEKNYT
ncbi:spermatogenesis-associated protein 6 [Platysternon megacephalum]|uniref:Spermatogenesis-associated protein 6 n=1 Tax=Platysternon megacephalum TaxID=55544 RepID=A0A4D9EJJ6_9SAUR|nr:spermatogenesis-associated protein 6 [Platysternon megacephalum]